MVDLHERVMLYSVLSNGRMLAPLVTWRALKKITIGLSYEKIFRDNRQILEDEQIDRKMNYAR